MAEGTNYKAAQNTIDITVVQKGAKLEVSSLAYTATYGDEDIDLGLTTEGESEVIYTTSNSNVATAGAGKLHIVGVGTATINLSMAASANYLAKDVDISVTIVPAELIITADDKETVYGTDAPEFTVSYSGFKNGDSAGKVGVLTGTLVFHCDYANGDDTYGIAGAYDIVPDGLAAGNYTITYKKGTLTVKKIESTVSIEDVAEKTYGDGAFDLSVTSTGSRNTPVYTSSDTSVLTVDGSGRVAVKGAGTATVTVTIPEETNYSSAVGSVTIMVKKKTLVVTAEDKNIDQGDAAPAYTVTYDGFVNGDNENNLGGALVFDCGYTKTGGAGKYAIIPGGLESDDYDINYKSGVLTVKRVDSESGKPGTGDGSGNGKPDTGKGGSVKTGDEAMPVVWMFTLLDSMGTIIFLYRKKREH